MDKRNTVQHNSMFKTYNTRTTNPLIKNFNSLNLRKPGACPEFSSYSKSEVQQSSEMNNKK